MYVCMHVYIHIAYSIRTYYVCMHVCTYVYVCMHACMYVRSSTVVLHSTYVVATSYVLMFPEHTHQNHSSTMCLHNYDHETWWQIFEFNMKYIHVQMQSASGTQPAYICMWMVPYNAWGCDVFECTCLSSVWLRSYRAKSTVSTLTPQLSSLDITSQKLRSLHTCTHVWPKSSSKHWWGDPQLFLYTFWNESWARMHTCTYTHTQAHTRTHLCLHASVAQAKVTYRACVAGQLSRLRAVLAAQAATCPVLYKRQLVLQFVAPWTVLVLGQIFLDDSLHDGERVSDNGFHCCCRCGEGKFGMISQTYVLTLRLCAKTASYRTCFCVMRLLYSRHECELWSIWCLVPSILSMCYQRTYER